MSVPSFPLELQLEIFEHLLRGGRANSHDVLHVLYANQKLLERVGGSAIHQHRLQSMALAQLGMDVNELLGRILSTSGSEAITDRNASVDMKANTTASKATIINISVDWLALLISAVGAADQSQKQYVSRHHTTPNPLLCLRCCTGDLLSTFVVDVERQIISTAVAKKIVLTTRPINDWTASATAFLRRRPLCCFQPLNFMSRTQGKKQRQSTLSPTCVGCEGRFCKRCRDCTDPCPNCSATLCLGCFPPPLIYPDFLITSKFTLSINGENMGVWIPPVVYGSCGSDGGVVGRTLTCSSCKTVACAGCGELEEWQLGVTGYGDGFGGGGVGRRRETEFLCVDCRDCRTRLNFDYSAWL